MCILTNSFKLRNKATHDFEKLDLIATTVSQLSTVAENQNIVAGNVQKYSQCETLNGRL